MLFAGKRDRAKAEGLLERVGLADRMRYHPAEMSVGQQQRVAIARALANDPALILADEPTGNLDPETGVIVLDLLREMCSTRGTTLVAVTHQPQVVEAFPKTWNLSES
jgi:putative ABC transport system ATP-binding protein